MPRTTVVTVTYNSAQTIGPMLDSLRDAHRQGLLDIVVVDNASRDATLDALAPYERGGMIRVVPAGGNIGFGRGCNLGASHAGSEFILFLNPDARLEPEAVATLERALDDHPRAAIAAPAIERPDHTLQPCGLLPSRRTLLLERTPLHRWAVKAWRPTPGAPPTPVRWVSGAAFMARRHVLAGLGGFDPRFFLYYEESDLFRRVLRAGHTILACPQALCHHIGGVSADAPEHAAHAGRIAGSIADPFIRSRNYYALKHFGPVLMRLADLAFCATLRVRGTLTRNKADRLTWQARRPIPMFALPAQVPQDAPGARVMAPVRTALPLEPAPAC